MRIEPKIQIEDYVLSEGHALAVRVAITSFHSNVSTDNDLRRDIGKDLADSYRDRLAEVLAVILRA